MDTTIKELMFDLADNKTVYSKDENRELSLTESNDLLRNICFEKTGLNEKSTERDIRRALKKESAREFFEIIEEILDEFVPEGFKDNEFFDKFVETKNLKDGDANEFWTDRDIILNVAKVSGSHHDLIAQKLSEGTPYSVPSSYYGMKVGHDIRMFLTGRKLWSDFIDAVGKAYRRKLRNEIYAEFLNLTDKADADLKGSGTPSAAKKADFDAIIEGVGGLNESDVVIMGTKSALKKITGFANVDWASDSMKEAIAETGILGTYEGTTLLEIPQRFEDNNISSALVDSTKLWIFPLVEDRPIKFVDYGETSLEVTEVGDTLNDQQTYELQRRMGIASIITRKFGVWSLA